MSRFCPYEPGWAENSYVDGARSLGPGARLASWLRMAAISVSTSVVAVYRERLVGRRDREACDHQRRNTNPSRSSSPSLMRCPSATQLRAGASSDH
jgi:hypothetical protein